MKKSILKNSILSGGLAALLLSFPAHADDRNLEAGQPTSIEDAYTIGRGVREFQSYASYERTGRNEDRFRWSNVLTSGPTDNTQVRLHVPLVFGSEDVDGLSGIGLEGMYSFNWEHRYIPALALAARVDAPVGDELSGADKEGWDTTLKILASHPVAVGNYQGALHLNAGWTHNFDEAPGERDDMYKVAAGYSQSVGEDVTVVLDLTREQHVVDDELENMAEIGVRQDLSETTTAHIGGGFGFGDDSSDFRVTLGLAKAF